MLHKMIEILSVALATVANDGAATMAAAARTSPSSTLVFGPTNGGALCLACSALRVVVHVIAAVFALPVVSACMGI